MTPSNTVANLALGLLPALTSADLMDVVARALNELNRRGADVSFGVYSLQMQWGDVQEDDGKFKAVFHDESIARIASEPVGGAA